MKNMSNLLLSLYERGLDPKEIIGNRKFSLFERNGDTSLIESLLIDGVPCEAFKTLLSNKDCVKILKDQNLSWRIFDKDQKHNSFIKELTQRAERDEGFKKAILSQKSNFAQMLIERDLGANFVRDLKHLFRAKEDDRRVFDASKIELQTKLIQQDKIELWQSLFNGELDGFSAWMEGKQLRLGMEERPAAMRPQLKI